jgi:hypothetical protein
VGALRFSRQWLVEFYRCTVVIREPDLGEISERIEVHHPRLVRGEDGEMYFDVERPLTGKDSRRLDGAKGCVQIDLVKTFIKTNHSIWSGEETAVAVRTW